MAERVKRDGEHPGSEDVNGSLPSCWGNAGPFKADILLLYFDGPFNMLVKSYTRELRPHP